MDYHCAMLSMALGILLASQAVSQPSPKQLLSRLNFMIGHWRGEGEGTPGDGKGEFSFEWDLGKSVLVRKNFAEYPATKDRPASRHDDLMIVFPENGKLKANYFDSEGHVIYYAVTIAADESTFQFLSDAGQPGPRYRLTYTRTGTDAMKLKFEIANPDKPDTFNSYIDATLHRIR